MLKVASHCFPEYQETFHTLISESEWLLTAWQRCSLVEVTLEWNEWNKIREKKGVKQSSRLKSFLFIAITFHVDYVHKGLYSKGVLFLLHIKHCHGAIYCRKHYVVKNKTLKLSNTVLPINTSKQQTCKFFLRWLNSCVWS